MREILFRGKTDKGEWVQGSLIKRNIGCFIVDENNKCALRKASEHLFDFESNLVIPETVGQYTGLTDKNGTKIFEGDIVSISGDFKGIYTCVWEEYHFDYELENKTMRCCLACVYSDDIKVIGNIIDNPELLGGD